MGMVNGLRFQGISHRTQQEMCQRQLAHGTIFALIFLVRLFPESIMARYK